MLPNPDGEDYLGVIRHGALNHLEILIHVSHVASVHAPHHALKLHKSQDQCPLRPECNTIYLVRVVTSKGL